MGDDPIAAWKNRNKLYSENNHFQELNRRYADGVRVENIPSIRDVGPPRDDSISDERPTV